MNSSKINFLSKSSILITGGTGSFGKAFVEKTLKKYPEVKITIFSRDEMKQWDMALEYKDDNRGLKDTITDFVNDVILNNESSLFNFVYIIHDL